MANTGQESLHTRGTNRDARPREKVRMSEEGATGKLAIKEGRVYLSEGVLVYMADGKRHRVPNELWAWTPSPTTYRRCYRCSFRDNCGRSVRHFMRNVRNCSLIPDSVYGIRKNTHTQRGLLRCASHAMPSVQLNSTCHSASACIQMEANMGRTQNTGAAADFVSSVWSARCGDDCGTASAGALPVYMRVGRQP